MTEETGWLCAVHETWFDPLVLEVYACSEMSSVRICYFKIKDSQTGPRRSNGEVEWTC